MFKRHMFKKDWTMFSIFIEYSILSSGYNWDDPCIQLKNQQENVALSREACP